MFVQKSELGTEGSHGEKRKQLISSTESEVELFPSSLPRSAAVAVTSKSCTVKMSVMAIKSKRLGRLEAALPGEEEVKT